MAFCSGGGGGAPSKIDELLKTNSCSARAT